MFGGYDDIEAFEDDLYGEESSSETSIDSEVEFHLYSQVHYAQAVSGREEAVESVPPEKQNPNTGNKQDQKINFIVISDSDVIQISDSPEFITLSDTPEEDSIYKSKLQKSTPQGSSALRKLNSFADPSSLKPIRNSPCTTPCSKEPAQKPSRKAKTKEKSLSFHREGVRMIHKILVIRDSSSDEDAGDVASTVSESDDVESWMLLGDASDDRDDTILLNLEGCRASDSQGESGAGWTISDKDLEARIGNYVSVRRNSRYYTPDKNVTCRNCDKRGHLSKNCPIPKKLPPCCLCAERGHLQNYCPARFCLNCCLPGHSSRECYERKYWMKHCNRCDMGGHYADACPEIWRQYHLTIRPGPLKKASSSYLDQPALAYCYNCAQKGHYGYECTEKRMVGGTFPTFPFIAYYDSKYDMERRSERAKNKAQELQEAGLLPVTSKRARMDDDRRVGGHKKRKRALEKDDRQEERLRKKLKKKTQAYKLKGRKCKELQDNGSVEENFPRGGHVTTPKHSKQVSTDCSFAHSRKRRGKPEILHASPEATKKQKRKKKRRNYSSKSPTRDESLFLIKQRKKKSKQKRRC